MGSDEAVKVNVVIIATTNRDLKDMEEKGIFRQDLYSRLSMIPLTMPALRNRPSDLDAIIDATLEDWNLRNAAISSKKTISDEARSILQDCNWPKNIRELQQTLTRICMLIPGDNISPEDLPQEILESVGAGYKSRIPSVLLPESGVKLRELILDIERAGGVMSKAAALVRIPANPATHSGFILPPEPLRSTSLFIQTQVAGLSQESRCIFLR